MSWAAVSEHRQHGRRDAREDVCRRRHFQHHESNTGRGLLIFTAGSSNSDRYGRAPWRESPGNQSRGFHCSHFPPKEQEWFLEGVFRPAGTLYGWISTSHDHLAESVLTKDCSIFLV